jgi:MFS family permease
MSQRDAGAAGDAADHRGAATAPATDSSAWAPLRQRAFRWLWIGVLVSWIGVWMQTVGAQWLLVDAPNAAALVSLVQAMNTLPIMLLALPGGVLADTFDRRWLLLSVQGYLFVVGILLAILTALGQMPPALLLLFTFALGAGGAVQLPTWQSMLPELVPRTQLRAAARLDLVGVNLARSVGPALAGVVIAHLGGVPMVFALNAASVVLFAVALLLWRRPRPESDTPRERFVPALRAGGRYIWHEPVMRRIMLRILMFVVPGMALWALLPLIATQRLHLGADGFGALFGALGAGAIVGAVVLAPVRARLSTNGMLTTAGVLYAAALAAIMLVPNFATALVTLVLGGLAWMAVTSTLVAELQLFLPTWVRARGLAVYTVTFTGSMTVGALLWGLVAEGIGLQAAMLISAVVVLAGSLVGLMWRLRETSHLDPKSTIYWPEARLAFEPEPDAGPVVVTVEYTVAAEQEAAYLEAMEHLRRSRRRTGASRWELYRDGEQPDHFTEIFTVPSWEEHERQHEGRLTQADKTVEDAALAFSDPPAQAKHLLPP